MFNSIQAVQATLEGVTTTEGRLAVSVVLVALAIMGGFVIAPYLVRRGVEFTNHQLRESGVGDYLEVVDDLLDLPFPMRAVVRTFQAVVLVTTAVALLVVWGYTETAVVVLAVLASVAPHFLRVVLTVVLLGGALAGTRYLQNQLNDWLADANYVSAHQEGVVFRVLQVCIFIAAGLAALSLWNVDLGGLLVGAGFLGIVLGMASRQTLGSLIAGFVLMFSRPLEIGDWVEVDGHEGVVVDITIINTRLRSFDGETIVLPNDSVSNSTVINRTRRRRLRLKTEVGVDYDADLERAEDVALAAIEDVDPVAPAPKPEVIPTDFGDSAVTLECRFWIQPPNMRKKWQAKRAVVHAVKEAYDREGIAIPYPQRQLSGRGADGVRIDTERGVDAEDDQPDEELSYSEE
ncbi:mechanosensitive ion channel family protein [Natrialbaceae archaeon A-gly3]